MRRGGHGEPASALDAPIQWELYGKIIGGAPVIRDDFISVGRQANESYSI